MDNEFRPAVLANRAFEKETCNISVPLVFGLERDTGKLSRFETRVFPETHPRAGANLYYAERILKFLIWQRGGSKVYIGRASRHRRIPSALLHAGWEAGFRLSLHERPGLRASFQHRALPPIANTACS